jgi:hypothetical protein
MIVLKFMAWMSAPNAREDKAQPASRDRVISCDSYIIEQYPESRSASVEVYRGNSLTPSETVIMGPAQSATDITHYRRLYVMNESGKTIDSYNPEERRG